MLSFQTGDGGAHGRCKSDLKLSSNDGSDGGSADAEHGEGGDDDDDDDGGGDVR
jgi:hypothetical protein